ncbi:Brp/Blh family beta-carotene 15,15'-dioxygenase [Modestobacter sp. VKM Ac-2984]|uniref:Brp/Blh family beta-carotene 15,15'-dioxygenase n=1 Tax=Modestobacter sp. VKM Ac-2984 TaxID=3004138 RepID=UPI0022AA4A15|nr:Brp/Blh family beta-carotene 15,15'-dioxygenase [Modestobacter sp. VKM Ac-2984]MCZ2818136.1 Brp/Blh family beta-carotene 15,15'-dioxygenase [Modestobacter sp. VKM Ac-2984]
MSLLPVRVRGPRGAPAPGRAVRPFDLPARAATHVSLGAVTAVLLVELLVPGGWGELAWVPLVAGLLLGLPHGAVDHLAPAHLLGWGLPRLGVFALLYGALAAIAYALFQWAPGPALLVFVALSAWHFGTGETAFADLRAARPVSQRTAIAVVLGGVVLLVPLVRGTAEAAAVVSAVVPGSDGVLPPWVPVLVLSLALPAAALLGLTLALSGRRLEALEVLVLLALVVVVPPFAAFGAYFGAWHSVRHLARVIAEDPANTADLTAGRLGAPVRRFAVQAALPTAVVLVVLGVLWSAADGWLGFVATDLPLLAALTLPHALVVTWLDRQATRPR